MAFDAIETTVANALLLKAQMGESQPIILRTRPFSDLALYAEGVVAGLSLSSLLQEPLGQYCFNDYLAQQDHEVLLAICTEIGLLRDGSGKSKRCRGSKIISAMIHEGSTATSPVSLRTSLGALDPSSIILKVSELEHSEGSRVAMPSPSTAMTLSLNLDLFTKGKATDASPQGSGRFERPSLDTMQPNKPVLVIGVDKTNSIGVKDPSGNYSDDEYVEKQQKGVGAKNHVWSTSMDMKTEHEDQRQALSMKGMVEGDKAIDRIRLDPETMNSFGKGYDLSKSSFKALPLNTSTSSSPEPIGPLSPSTSIIHWNSIITKNIPDAILETMALAIKHPALLETSRMMEVFEAVYGILYNELSHHWFHQFIKDGEPFETYIRHREYAETSKIGFDQFQMFRALGKGAFGLVSAVQKKDTKKVYAMKSMSKRKIKHYHSEKLCEIEKGALQKVDSPFILNLKYAFTNDKNVFLILDLCNGGDLQFHLTEVRGHRFTESRARFYAAEVILALEHLHKNKFVYRDLKPGNILINSDGHIVMSDLGLVHRVSSKRPLRTLAGTSGYWAPEVMKRQIYDFTADWWSFGVFLHKLLSGRRPRCDCKRIKQWCPFGTKKDHAEMAKAGEPMTFELVLDDVTFGRQAQDLLRKLLEPDPLKRLGANGVDEVKKHSFFRGIQWQELLEKQIEPPFKPTKTDINAVSLAELSSEGDRKLKKTSFDDKDEKFYEKWDYISVKTIQEEIVGVLEHNLQLAKRPPKPLPTTDPSRRCCIIL